jgi:hypothetical protein
VIGEIILTGTSGEARGGVGGRAVPWGTPYTFDSASREAPQLGGCETPGSAREGGLHVQVLLQAAVMDQSRMVAEVLGGPGF